MFSRKLSAVDAANSAEAIRELLRQLNCVQEELERRVARLEQRISSLESG